MRKDCTEDSHSGEHTQAKFISVVAKGKSGKQSIARSQNKVLLILSLHGSELQTHFIASSCLQYQWEIFNLPQLSCMWEEG